LLFFVLLIFDRLIDLFVLILLVCLFHSIHIVFLVQFLKVVALKVKIVVRLLLNVKDIFGNVDLSFSMEVINNLRCLNNLLLFNIIELNLLLILNLCGVNRDLRFSFHLNLSN